MILNKHTLSVKENEGGFLGGFLGLQVRKFKNTLKVLNIILAMWWYYIILEHRISTEENEPTLHVITNKDDFPDGGEVGEKGNIIPNFYLRSLINNHSVKRIPFKDTLLPQHVTGEHAKSTKHNWTAIEFIKPSMKFTTGDGLGLYGGI